MNVLSVVLVSRGDPRWAELPREALALLDPLPAGSALIEALSEVARAEALRGSPDAAISVAERALRLADELALDRPPRALGYRGTARTDIGDAAGIEDMREAIRLATNAGQGREVALLHNNLGFARWAFQGPKAAITELDNGIAYANARGVAEAADWATVSRLDPLFDAGQLDEALALASALTERLHDDQLIHLSEVRGVEARVHTLRGQPVLAADYLDWLEITSRDAGAAEVLVFGLGAAAITHAALGHLTNAAALLAELAAAPGTRGNTYYAALLATLVRTALIINQPDVAQSLISDYQPHTPYAQHALTTATAALAEAWGDHQAAVDGYADAAERWEQFGVIPENAYALQGHGRCLIHLGRVHEAAPMLQHARELFTQIQASPALGETDTLLQRAVARSS